MAEIIRGTGQSGRGQANISTNVAASSSSGGEAIGAVTQKLGAGIANSQMGNAIQDLGSTIVNQGLADLAQVKSSIQSSIYADKMNQANLEFAALAQQRTDKQFDDKGRPGFLSLTEDLGKLGTQTLEKYLKDVDDPVVREKLTSNFTSQINNYQIGSLSTARNQQLDFSNATYNEFKRITLEQAKVDNPQNIPLHLGRLQEVLGDRIAAGEMSVEQAQAEYQNASRNVGVFQASRAIENDPYGALQNLQEDNNPLGLNSEDLQALRQQAVIGVQKTEAARQAQEKAIMQENEFLVKQIEDIQLNGGSVPVEMRQYLLEQYKGSPMEGTIKGLLDQGTVLEHFSSLSAADQASFLNEINSTVITDPKLAGLSQKVRTIYTNTQKAIKEDPVAFAAKQGLLKETAPLDFGNLAESLQQKKEAFAAASQHLGVQGSGLTKEEQSQIVASYNTSGPDQQLAMATQIRAVYGDRAGILFDEIYKQAGAKDMVYDIYQTQQGKETLVKDRLLGKQIWKDGNIPLPKREEVGSKFAEKLPKSFNQAQKSALIDAAIDHYALLQQSSGRTSESVDNEIVEAIVQRLANPITRNGITTQIDDSTLNEESFNLLIDNTTPDQFSQFGGINPEQLHLNDDETEIFKQSQLVHVGNNQYMVILPPSHGGTVALDKNNRELIIDLKRLQDTAVPVTRAAEPLSSKVTNILKGIIE